MQHELSSASDDDAAHMDRALELARAAGRADEVPVGAIIVRGDEIVASAANEVEARSDALAHAEMLALRQAQTRVGDWRLTECTLYVTKEPCPMCAGAIIHTRLKRVVFGVGDPKAGALGGACDLLKLPGINHRCEVTPGIKADDARDLLRSFFQARRDPPLPPSGSL